MYHRKICRGGFSRKFHQKPAPTPLSVKFIDNEEFENTSALTIGNLSEANNPKSNQIKEKIRETFERYIKSIYSSNNFLPVAKNFENFPYLSFRSLGLESQWHLLFDQNLLVASPELNTLALMLSSTHNYE